MITIVFSRDRALQLHAFLRSYQRHVTPLRQVTVLYRATTPRHARAYEEVFARFGFVLPVPERVFAEDLLTLLPTLSHVIFFVDDQLFLRHWVVLEEAGLSLRLGTNLTRNYPFGSVLQPLPAFAPVGEDRLRWRWATGQLDWGYPFSVDGHVYDLAQLRPMIESVPFHSPNTLEHALQQFVPQFEYGTCYHTSKVVNIPWNCVQVDWANRHMNAHDVSAEALLGHWEAGLQVNLAVYDDIAPFSAHQEFPLRLEPRC